MKPRRRLDAVDVRRAAVLSGLALSSQELEQFANDLAAVLDEFEHIDASELPRLASRDRHLETHLRPDAPDSDRLHGHPSEFAPDWREGFFVVPRLPALDR